MVLVRFVKSLSQLVIMLNSVREMMVKFLSDERILTMTDLLSFTLHFCFCSRFSSVYRMLL